MSEKLFKKMEMQIKQNTVQFENHVNTYNAEISLLASKKELQKVYNHFKLYCSYEHLENFKNEVYPLIKASSERLEKYAVENEQIKGIVLRFDEVISDKVNKFSLEVLRKEIKDEYLRADQVFDISKKFDTMMQANEKLTEENELKQKSNEMRLKHTIKELVNHHLTKKMKKYE